MILVTGASGTVGSEVLKQLRQEGADVRAAFPSAEKAARAKKQGIDSVVPARDHKRDVLSPSKLPALQPLALTRSEPPYLIAQGVVLMIFVVLGGQLKVYKGGSHGMCTTQKNEVNADLLAFIKG